MNDLPGPVSPQTFALIHRWLSEVVAQRISCPQIMVAPLRSVKQWDPNEEPKPAKRYDSWQIAEIMLKRMTALDYEATAWREAAMKLLTSVPWNHVNAVGPRYLNEALEARRIVERLWREHLEVHGGESRP